jgi:hypothetical protein
MADITVKKNDGATNIVWTALSPSSGDGVHAVWRSETVGTAAGHKPMLETWSRFNGNRTARRFDMSGIYPQIATDSTTGLVSVINKAPFNASFLLPLGMPATDTNEFVAQMSNLIVSTLIQSCIKSGYAAS